MKLIGNSGYGSLIMDKERHQDTVHRRMGTRPTEYQRSEIQEMHRHHRQPVRNGNGQDQDSLRSPHSTRLPCPAAGETPNAPVQIRLSEEYCDVKDF